MSRYVNDKIITDDSEYYNFLRKKRKIKAIQYYGTKKMKHPSVKDRAKLMSNNHIWKYGDRFYNLAHSYYGDPSLWWVIAWYNAIPTESDIKIGDVIRIPLNAENVLTVLGY